MNQVFSASSCCSYDHTT